MRKNGVYFGVVIWRDQCTKRRPAEHFGEQAVVVLLEVVAAAARNADCGLKQVDLLASRLLRVDGRGAGSDGERRQDGEEGHHLAAGRLHVFSCTACT